MNRRAGLVAAMALLMAAPVLAQGDYHIPVPAQKKLANGMRVVVFPRPGAGLVQVQLLVGAGANAELPEAPGAATLVAQLLRQGTSSRSVEVFDRDLGLLGGTFSVSAQREFTSLGAAFLPEDFEGGLELVSDAVINPLFDAAQFEHLRTVAVRQMLQLHADPVLTAEEQMWGFALPGVPAARPPLGNLASLFNLGRESLRAYHRNQYRPDRAVLAIAGDITPERAFTIANQWFARWVGNAAPLPPVNFTAATAPRILLVDRSDLSIAAVRLGWALPGKGAEDELARTAGVRLLDQRLKGRLGAALPGRPPVDVSLGLVRGAGLLTVAFVVPADSVSAAVARARRIVGDAVVETPAEADLAMLRRQVVSGYPLRFEVLGGLMSQWLTSDFDGNDADRALAGYPGRVVALTPASVAAALRRGFVPDAPAVVVVGPSARMRAGLAKLGTVQVTKLDEPPAQSSVAPVDTLAPMNAASALRGRELGGKVIAAHGGLDKLREIHDSIVDSRITLTLEDRELHGEMRQVRAEPYRMLFLTTFEQFESRQVLNGNRAWSITNDSQLQDADSIGVRALRAGFTSDVPHLLLALADTAASLEARGKAQLDGRDVEVLDVRAPGGDRRRLYLDPTNSRLIAMDQNEESARNGRLTARRYYRDLRVVKGVLLPWEEERQLEGRTVMKLFASKVDTNIGVSDLEFQRPTSVPSAPPKK